MGNTLAPPTVTAAGMLLALRLPSGFRLRKQGIRLVVGDAEKPGGEPSGIFQLAKVLNKLEKHVLLNRSASSGSEGCVKVIEDTFSHREMSK